MIDLDLNQVGIPFDFAELFGRSVAVDLEIGSGKGKFLLEMAQASPDRDFLAVERAGKYHQLCCDRAARRGIDNVRLLRTSAEDLLFRLLRDASLANVTSSSPTPGPRNATTNAGSSNLRSSRR
ncbi:MAG: hypothetical protein E4H44_06565 [Candidatus Aminicenantes bacterium]|nr:MAG: hypothetical protein E4H44_06565 [Candidatus Aminicenantes bacterium]